MSAPETQRRNKLAAETREKFPNDAVMMIGPQEAAVLQVLLLASGARNVLEIGTFTGYSALAMQEVLPIDGEIWTFEADAKHADVAQRYFAEVKAQRRAKIVLRHEDARAIPWPSDAGAANFPPFDVAFIDADKAGYIAYWEKCTSYVGEGGLLIADNTLSYKRKEASDPNGKAIADFNKFVREDREVHVALTTIRDGMTIAYVK